MKEECLGEAHGAYYLLGGQYNPNKTKTILGYGGWVAFANKIQLPCVTDPIKLF
jgi:hypothetical protein